METAKAMTFLEREAVAMMHHSIYGRDETFYASHKQDRRSCLGIFASGGTNCNIQGQVQAESLFRCEPCRRHPSRQVKGALRHAGAAIAVLRTYQCDTT